MKQLSDELAELDAVRQDVLRTQALIRRDTANAVLQTALCIKQSQTETLPVEITSQAIVPADLGAPQSDEWANRLVRWADQFGRELFKRPASLRPAAKAKPSISPKALDNK